MRIGNASATVALAASLAAPALAAQEHRLPDSLAHRRYPADPAEFARQAMAGKVPWEVVDGDTAWVMRSMFDVGCPSDGGYAGAAYAALERMAETDSLAQNAVVGLWYWELGRAHDFESGQSGGPVCPADFPRERIEVLLAGRLRQVWESGALASPATSTVLYEPMTWARAPEAYAILRDIARDPEVYVEPRHFRDGFEVDYRRDAARRMAEHLINGGMSWTEAVKAVEADLAGAPPVLGDWRPRGS